MPRAATKRTVVTRAFSSRTTRPSACEHTVIAQTRPCRGVLSHALNPPRYLICSGRVRIHTSSKRSAATIEDRNWSICLDEVGLCPRRSVAKKSPNDLPTPTGNSGNTQSPEERHLRISRRRTYGRCRSGDGREGGTRWVRAGNHDRTGVGGLFRCVRFFHASRTTVCVKLLKSQARLHYSSKFPEQSPRPKRTATRFFFSGAPNCLSMRHASFEILMRSVIQYHARRLFEHLAHVARRRGEAAPNHSSETRAPHVACRSVL